LYIITLDGGKTRTSCAVLDSKGNVLSHAIGKAVGTSLLSSPVVESNIRNVVFEALRRSRLNAGDIGIASFTVCDLDTKELKRSIEESIHKMGFGGEVILEPDYVGAYYVATHGSPGVGIIAGTGSIAYGEDGHGKKARAGGWGWFIGDEGSGIWIGARALNAMARAYDGTGKETSLLVMICKELKIKNCMDLMNIAYKEGTADASLASRVAPLVNRAAAEGDTEAVRILQQAGRELALMTLTVSSKLGLDEGKHIVGCVGSVFKSNIVLDTFRNLVRKQTKTVEFRGPFTDYLPLMGPAVMAFKVLEKRSPSETILETISKNLEGISRPSQN